jgi:hypothetical protein
MLLQHAAHVQHTVITSCLHAYRDSLHPVLIQSSPGVDVSIMTDAYVMPWQVNKVSEGVVA